ncbi:hypothetical protein NP233_g8868 [Leucocoprinus birnbaumii]|uniref:cAMP-independent regulatory protein pac2 n=1 Tax=Leucocoprinus birnbaumii TaxID=56174 RepID=A0AAD5VN77_9AGAR|nr:hypothetical protein NP233_g8868 [Leucocoprinus birnbaumii]
MQHPTCTNIRIRSVSDAHKIFFAVHQGILQMVTRRLDADERMQLRTGCVYAWEERGPHTELTGLGIERFTEGRRWSPSRVRDEFLFYYEKYSPSPECANPHPPRDWDPLVKQTYSVWVDTDRGRRKWHLTAYFTQSTVDHLGSIDDMRVVRDLVVPEDMFKSTRVNKGRSKNNENGGGETSKPTNTSSASRFAPFPAPTLPNQHESSGQILMFQPYTNHDASAPRQHQVLDDTETAAQQIPAARSSNPYPAQRDLNQFSTQNYRPLLPSTHPRNPADHLLQDLREYNLASQPVPVRFNNDAQHPAVSLAQARLEGQRSPQSHLMYPSSTHISSNLSSSTAYHNDVNTTQSYTSDSRSFSTSTSSWVSANSRTDAQNSVVYEDNSASLATAATHLSSSFPPSHIEMSTGDNSDPFRIMPPLLNLPLGDLAGGTSARRENLPPISLLEEACSISYDFSLSVVGPINVSSHSESVNHAPHGKSSSTTEHLQSSKASAQGTNRSGGLFNNLDLAPLNSLARCQPYRREPMDDRALRLLWPRSP